MPKIIRKNPLKNFGLFSNTTFINSLRQHFAADSPSTITQIASAATKNRGGQKQLSKSPTENEIAMKPLLNENRFRILIPPYNTIISGKLKNVTFFYFLTLPKASNPLIHRITVNRIQTVFSQFCPALRLQ